MNVHIELTDKCNALCSMCGRQYIENGELKRVPTFDKNELSITEIRNIFDNRFFEKFNLNRIISVVILATLLLAWIYALL